MGLRFLPYEKQFWQPHHIRTTWRRYWNYERTEVNFDALMNTEERVAHERADCKKENVYQIVVDINRVHHCFQNVADENVKHTTPTT